MKLVAVLALAGGALAAPLVTASPAGATPCNSADCVPYVDRNINPSESCVPGGSRYLFGLDASGNNYLCNVQGEWVAQPALVGVRTNGLPCHDSTGVAQTPDGLVLTCKAGAWKPDFTTFYYS
ncbi:hypothetical protein [Mycolicibacterium litorale]|uniref:Secreted protein n=1 Tax=Mycolicibacterium litorale TaxID=758802 RepID=A0AAD1IPD8_9MYCO|nr:hypothetical protein [Mycolicibacterium litorale]MCV7417822.1 hypothetical protein [Mycolicibacterium litorale]TDY06789.1 hypothetical protein BCL50_3124 [Mycolicibacterium litorale]BBY19055.1 hypothetical protein MLIT_46470 [Mycolicibacterium litorale]